MFLKIVQTVDSLTPGTWAVVTILQVNKWKMSLTIFNETFVSWDLPVDSNSAAKV